MRTAYIGVYPHETADEHLPILDPPSLNDVSSKCRSGDARRSSQVPGFRTHHQLQGAALAPRGIDVLPPVEQPFHLTLIFVAEVPLHGFSIRPYLVRTGRTCNH